MRHLLFAAVLIASVAAPVIAVEQTWTGYSRKLTLPVVRS